MPKQKERYVVVEATDGRYVIYPEDGIVGVVAISSHSLARGGFSTAKALRIAKSICADLNSGKLK